MTTQAMQALTVKENPKQEDQPKVIEEKTTPKVTAPKRRRTPSPSEPEDSEESDEDFQVALT